MIKRLIVFLLLLPTIVLSEVYVSDDFEISGIDWDGQTDNISLIDSTEGTYGEWNTIWPNSQTAARHGEIAAAYGHTGKGFRFSMDNSGGTTQESNMFGGGTAFTATSLFWGFWHKMDQVIVQSVPLKMTRFYASEAENVSIIPEWYGSQWNFFYDGTNHFVSTENFELADTNWHKYVMEFQRGNNTNDGVIRMWVDDVLVYEDTAVDWNDTGTVFAYDLFPMIQGNLSGSYSGGAFNTFFDDFIFASTKAEVESFLGAAPSDSNTQLGSGTQKEINAAAPSVVIFSN